MWPRPPRAAWSSCAPTCRAARRRDRTPAIERIVGMQSELTFALKSLEELKQGLSSAGQAAVTRGARPSRRARPPQHVGDGSNERVTEVFQQILGLAARATQPTRRPPGPAARRPSPSRQARAAPRLRRRGPADGDPRASTASSRSSTRPSPSSWATRSTSSRRPPGPRRTTAAIYKEQLEQLRQIGAGEMRERRASRAPTCTARA